VLGIAWSETKWSYTTKHPDKNTIGIGGIKRLWNAELRQNNIKLNSLQAIEYLYLKTGLKAYKGTIKNNKSYIKTKRCIEIIKRKIK